MYTIIWNMSAPQQTYQPLSSDIFMESYSNDQSMSNVPYSSIAGQNEQEDAVRRAWIRPLQPQQSYATQSSKQNQASIPRSKSDQNRLPNLLESISESDGASAKMIKSENAQIHHELQCDQNELPLVSNNILPVPLTIDPSATHDLEFWNQHRQSSLTSNFFNGSSGLYFSARPQTAGNLSNEVANLIYAENNGDESGFSSSLNGQSIHDRSSHPNNDLLPAPTIRSDKIPIYSTDKMFNSWFDAASSNPNHNVLTSKTLPQMTKSHFPGIMNSINSSVLSTSKFHSHNWRITPDIVLTAPECQNGERIQDIHYPNDPRPEDVWHSLQEPNAPEFPHLSAATINHLEFYDYGQLQVPRDQIIPAPANDRAPGVMPYNSPPMESYLHINPKHRPIRQDEKLRFPADLYTPRWVRGDGPAREGFCSLCEEGTWLQLKTSQYWYHVRFTHGVNSNTGKIYDPPLRLRICDDPMSSTFGFCGECHQWIAICTPRRKRCFTAWFKHAHACHRFQHSMGHYLPFQEETNEEETPATSSEFDRSNVEDISDQSAEESDELISSPPSHADQHHNSQMIISGQPLQSFEKDKVSQRLSWTNPAVRAPFSNDQVAILDDDIRQQAQPILHERTLGHRRSASDGWLGLQASSSMTSNDLFNDIPHRPRAETSVKDPFIITKGQKPLRSRKKQSGILKPSKKV